jgi:hypothetical protein
VVCVSDTPHTIERTNRIVGLIRALQRRSVWVQGRANRLCWSTVLVDVLSIRKCKDSASNRPRQQLSISTTTQSCTSSNAQHKHITWTH